MENPLYLWRAFCEKTTFIMTWFLSFLFLFTFWLQGRMRLETGWYPVFYPAENLHFLSSSENFVVELSNDLFSRCWRVLVCFHIVKCYFFQILVWKMNINVLNDQLGIATFWKWNSEAGTCLFSRCEKSTFFERWAVKWQNVKKWLTEQMCHFQTSFWLTSGVEIRKVSVISAIILCNISRDFSSQLASQNVLRSFASSLCLMVKSEKLSFFHL